MTIAVRLVVTGRVQGVFFRDWTVREATALDLAGWVRNRRDGSVEIAAKGTEEAVERFVTLCREGPERATVERVKREDIGDEPIKENAFTRRATL